MTVTQSALGLLCILFVVLIYIGFAGQGTILLRNADLLMQGLLIKVGRLVQHQRRNLKCFLGAHTYRFDWNTPYFTQPATCTWCGRKGPWRRIP